MLKRSFKRNPFVTTNPVLKPTVEVAVAKAGDEAAARYFHITSVFFGANLRAVRVEGRRVTEGQWFKVDGGKVTDVGEEGDFLLETVTPEWVYFRHKNGETVKRPSNLRRQETPPPPPSPAASASADVSAPASPTSSGPAAASSPSPASP